MIEREQRSQAAARRQARCRTRAARRAAETRVAAPVPEPPVRRCVRPRDPEVQSPHPWTCAWSIRRQRELAGSLYVQDFPSHPASVGVTESPARCYT